MNTLNKIVELINRFEQEIKHHYRKKGRFEAEREINNADIGYGEGVNDGVILAKEKFIEELKELKEYCNYE